MVVSDCKKFIYCGFHPDLQIAVSLEACVNAYIAGTRYAELQKVIYGEEPEDKVYEGYKNVILSKAEEDALVSVLLHYYC